MRLQREFLLEQSALLVDQLGKYEKWNDQAVNRLRSAEYITAVGGNEADCAHISADTEVDRISTECSRQIILKIRAALSLISIDLKQNPTGDHQYGLCQSEECGSPIATKRLRKLPWAERCLACQNKDEGAIQGNKGFNPKEHKIVRNRSIAPGVAALILK